MKRPILIALALIAMLGFVALGIWQIERRAWKLDLIARVDARVHAAPVAVRADMNAKAEEYRHVALSGVFLCGRETLVQALTVRGAGYWVIAPMRTARGVVLVNRGFVPSGRASPFCGTARPETVTGLLRVSEPGGSFLRANDPAANRWYSRDVTAIARARGLGPVAPFFIDADFTPPDARYPVGGLTVVHFNNNHLLYALTWFGLAGLCGFAAFLLLRQRAA